MIMKNLEGKRFGKLTVISFSHKEKGKSHDKYYWNCKCDCGKEVIKERANLVGGRSTNCGCVRHEILSNKQKTHGLSNHPLYNVWRGIKKRCYLKSNSSYKHYGGKGIIVCDEWLGKDGFYSFYQWAMSNGYKENLQIDRIDFKGNYEPSNCRFVDPIIQQNNKSNIHLIQFNGESHSIGEWGRLLGVERDTLWKRINKYGWSIEKALSTPVERRIYGTK